MSWTWLWDNAQTVEALGALALFGIPGVVWLVRRLRPALRAECRVYPYFGFPVERPNTINEIIWTVANKTDTVSTAITKIIGKPVATEAGYSKTVSKITLRNRGSSTFHKVQLHIRYPFFVFTKRTGKPDQRTNYTKRQSVMEVLELGDMPPGEEVSLTIWASPDEDEFRRNLKLYHSTGRGRVVVYGLAHPAFWRINWIVANIRAALGLIR